MVREQQEEGVLGSVSLAADKAFSMEAQVVSKITWQAARAGRNWLIDWSTPVGGKWKHERDLHNSRTHCRSGSPYYYYVEGPTVCVALTTASGH